MSAPASAYTRASAARSSTVRSLSTSGASVPGAISPRRPQCPWSVYSQRQTSAMTRRSSPASFIARIAAGTIPSGSYPEVPTASFSTGIPNRRTAGIPRPATSRHCSTRRSTDSWWFPGIDRISLCTPSPGQTKNGITKSSVRKLVSRTMLRMRRLRRRRRGRCGPISPGAFSAPGTPVCAAFIDYPRTGPGKR